MMGRLIGIVIGIGALLAWLAGTVTAQQPKVIVIAGRAHVDAVQSLGCKLGVGEGTGNGAKVNDYLDGRPEYPLFIPGGHFEVDETIVIPNKSGMAHLVGNGAGVHLHDAAYVSTIQGGQPTRLVWTGPAGGTMIQFDARHGYIGKMQLQGRLMPNGAQTANKCRIGIHVRTEEDTDISTGSLRMEDLTFDDVPNGVLFGRDLDTAIATVGADLHADSCSWNNLFFNHPYTDGEGTGTLTTRTSDTAGVITLSGSTHGITQGSPVAISWSGGARTGMYCTAVSGADITLSGGSGTVLPATTTAMTAWEERTCFRWRTHQALGFTGGFVQTNGHPREVFWFERGSGLAQQRLVVSTGDTAMPVTVLRLGSVTNGAYDIGLHLDGGVENFKLLEMVAEGAAGTDGNCTVNIRNVGQGQPSGSTYAVPIVDAHGAVTVTLHDFQWLLPGSIKLRGNAGSGSQRQRICICHLNRCSMYSGAGTALWPDVLLDAGTGPPYLLRWKDCVNRYVGAVDNTGFTNLPVADGEVKDGYTQTPAP